MKFYEGMIVPENKEELPLLVKLCHRFSEIGLPIDAFKHENIANEFAAGSCMMLHKKPDGKQTVSILRNKA